MLALAYYNNTFDIYEGAVCFMFYRFFEYGVGMVWVRIILPDDFDKDRVCVLLRSLKVDEPRSFDYWSAKSRLFIFEIGTEFQKINSDMGYLRREFLKSKLIPLYQMRSSLKPMVVYGEPLLFGESTDPVLKRVRRKLVFAKKFSPVFRDKVAF